MWGRRKVGVVEELDVGGHSSGSGVGSCGWGDVGDVGGHSAGSVVGSCGWGDLGDVGGCEP